MASTMTEERALSPGEVPETQALTERPQEWAQNLNIHLVCADCKEYPPNLVEEFASGDTVCGSCGLVLQSHVVDTRSEWRTFSNDDQGNDDPSRIGEAANPLLNGSQLSTTIAYGQGDARSRDLNRAQNRANADKTTKALLAAYKQIGTLCDSYHLSHSVADTARQLYKMTDDTKAFKGKSQDAIIASTIFISCRQNNVPRTFKEITSLTKVPKKEIGRTFKALEKFFQKHTQSTVAKNETYTTTTSTKAQDLCGRYCSGLDLPQQISVIAGEYADEMIKAGLLAGRSPLSIAAVSIYMMSHLMGMPKTPKEISLVAGVSDGTIRTAYRHIFEDRKALIKPVWLEKGGNMDLLPQA
ncbi:cyclin-like protein [Trichodelitschia bisporula]|uniref:Transcription initiation factor IIB n=1 Tax=Trichodelitschia bisporula TaxID=703511 RepID=A0A6G1IAM3_9PEZI|nr:cyclin-like protein [Trichodelitschia bisporula]